MAPKGMASASAAIETSEIFNPCLSIGRLSKETTAVCMKTCFLRNRDPYLT